MLYAAMTLWLLVAVLTAWGVHRLWCSVLPVKVVNVALLPGTLIAVLGHVAGLLMTGATVTSATLYKDDGSGDPEMTRDPKPRIPVIGAIIIGLLPLLACGSAIFLASRYLGSSLMQALPSSVGPDLPMSLAALFDFLRAQVSLVESLITALRECSFSDWRTVAFVYLLVCLTIRMGPFQGTARGALGAIILLGASMAGIATLFGLADPRVQTGWAVLNLTIASLFLLLFLSLILRGFVGLVQILHKNA